MKTIFESENFSLEDVVLVRAYVIDLSLLAEFDKAFQEFFLK